VWPPRGQTVAMTPTPRPFRKCGLTIRPLDFSSFSRESLFDQLVSEYGSQFTPAEAEFALAAVGY